MQKTALRKHARGTSFIAHLVCAVLCVSIMCRVVRVCVVCVRVCVHVCVCSVRACVCARAMVLSMDTHMHYAPLL